MHWCLPNLYIDNHWNCRHHIYVYRCTLAFYLCLSLSFALSLPFSLSLSLFLSLSNFLSRSFSFSLSLSLSLFLSLSFFLSCSLSLSHTHTHTHAHIRTQAGFARRLSSGESGRDKETPRQLKLKVNQSLILIFFADMNARARSRSTRVCFISSRSCVLSIFLEHILMHLCVLLRSFTFSWFPEEIRLVQ